jgi:hypothetical protein
MTNNKQQTAVEWLQSIELQRDLTLADWKKAKGMEKERTIKLYADYENYLEESFKNQCGGQAVVLSFGAFYEQTYGGDKQ